MESDKRFLVFCLRLSHRDQGFDVVGKGKQKQNSYNNSLYVVSRAVLQMKWLLAVVALCALAPGARCASDSVGRCWIP